MVLPTYLAARYMKPKYKCARNFVSTMKACEGLLMNIVAFLETRKYPVWIEGNSDYPRHTKENLRAHSMCLKEFGSVFELDFHDLPTACVVFTERKPRSENHRETLNVSTKEGLLRAKYIGRPPNPYPFMYAPGGDKDLHRIDSNCGGQSSTKSLTGGASEKKAMLTYIPVLGHSNQLHAIKNSLIVARALGVKLLIPRFYAFSTGHTDEESASGSAVSRPSAKYSELYDLKHLKKLYKSIGEIDDYHTPISCILNVSLNLASRRFYTGVVDPLEYYMDLGLLSPSTRLFQLNQLPSLGDLRRALKKKDLDVIGLSQAYKIQGVGQSLNEYLIRNGANQRLNVRHRFSQVLVKEVIAQLRANEISEYGCVHIRLGDFADYCKMNPATWASADKFR